MWPQRHQVDTQSGNPCAGGGSSRRSVWGDESGIQDVAKSAGCQHNHAHKDQQSTRCAKEPHKPLFLRSHLHHGAFPIRSAAPFPRVWLAHPTVGESTSSLISRYLQLFVTGGGQLPPIYWLTLGTYIFGRLAVAMQATAPASDETGDAVLRVPLVPASLALIAKSGLVRFGLPAPGL